MGASPVDGQAGFGTPVPEAPGASCALLQPRAPAPGSSSLQAQEGKPAAPRAGRRAGPTRLHPRCCSSEKEFERKSFLARADRPDRSSGILGRGLRLRAPRGPRARRARRETARRCGRPGLGRVRTASGPARGPRRDSKSPRPGLFVRPCARGAPPERARRPPRSQPPEPPGPRRGLRGPRARTGLLLAWKASPRRGSPEAKAGPAPSPCGPAGDSRLRGWGLDVGVQGG